MAVTGDEPPLVNGEFGNEAPALVNPLIPALAPFPTRTFPVWSIAILFGVLSPFPLYVAFVDASALS